MRLQEVEIIDFKSITREKIQVQSNQLCIVGKNESGKSSIIQAISYLNPFENELSSTQHLNRNATSYPSGLPMIIGVFSLTERDFAFLCELLRNNLDITIYSTINGVAEDCALQIKRWGNGISNLSISITDKKSYGLDLSSLIDSKAKFYNDFFEKIYPSIEYYEKEELLIEPAKVDDLLGNDKRFETFRRLLIIGGCTDISLLNREDENFIATFLSKIESNINDILKKHYKQDDSISVRIQPTFGNKLNLIIRDGTNQSFTIHERSPGFQYYFSFLINKLYTKSINKDKSIILLLDEPGGSLHPKGAKDLLKSFDEISENSQILYTTHNPFLAVRNCIDSLIFVSKSPNAGTKINKKPFLNKYQILRKELGIVLNDSFLIGDMNLIVEGNTEKLAFHRLFQLEKYKGLEWINIYSADGVTNVPQAINYLGKNNLNLSGIAVLDSDMEASEVKKNKAYKNNISEDNWAEVEVNDAFKDKKTRTFEDLFPQERYVRAFNKYCHSLQNLEIFDKAYIDFRYIETLETPIIDKLNEHFKNFLPENSKASITKQDVMRYLLDEIDELENVERNEVLDNAFKLMDKIKSAIDKIEKNANN
jgi:predicted ATP-dependent endonuclease of OLD family